MIGEPRIRVSAVLRWRGAILLCRHEKPGKEYWLLPGGGVDSGESLVDALRRELAEEIGIDEDVPVARIPLDVKELAQRGLGVAVLHGQGGDLGGALAGQVVGRDALGLDGDRGRAVVLESEHGRSPVRWWVV